MINPEKELFFWGPSPGKPIYVSYFMVSIADRSPKFYKWHWPEFMFYFIKGKMTFVCEDDILREVGKKYFNEFIITDQFELVKERYQKALVQLREVQSKIKNLDQLSNEEFKSLYLEFYEAYLTFWDHGLVPEMANWGGEIILKEKLNIPKEKFAYVYEKLTAPSGLSFYQEEELDLLKVKKGDVSITEHQNKYFWINNSYFESLVLDENFFKTRLNEMEKINVDEEISRIKDIPIKSQELKEKVITEFSLSPEVKKISERLSYCIYWQDDRKGDIFIANHYIWLLLQEISKRYDILTEHLEQYWCWEMPELLEGKKVTNMNERLEKQAGYMAAKEGGNKVLTGEFFDKNVLPLLNKSFDTNVNEVNGLVVNSGEGIIQGKARILFDPKDHTKMQQGEILIAPMTSPEYILALRKASAVITDTGGMTCHAAIVARELNIPGIVGTKISTKIFKDNDLIEVNTKIGVVRKL
jgi:phosphohistidine swiveling domain-containing protein